MSTTGRAAELLLLLRMSGVPWGTFLSDPSERPVFVRDLVEHLETAATASWDERDIDELIRELGGRREGIQDPWTWPMRKWKRLTGAPVPSTDVYFIPKNILE